MQIFNSSFQEICLEKETFTSFSCLGHTEKEKESDVILLKEWSLFERPSSSQRFIKVSIQVMNHLAVELMDGWALFMVPQLKSF